LWQVSHETGLPAAFKAACPECAPAMFGYAAPAGAEPFGGSAWQEVQFNAVSGEAAWWHVTQTGPDLAVGAETSWQVAQLPVNVDAVTP
jgi:hypothetical protein